MEVGSCSKVKSGFNLIDKGLKDASEAAGSYWGDIQEKRKKDAQDFYNGSLP